MTPRCCRGHCGHHQFTWSTQNQMWNQKEISYRKYLLDFEIFCFVYYAIFSVVMYLRLPDASVRRQTQFSGITCKGVTGVRARLQHEAIIALFSEPPARMTQAQEGVRVSWQRPVVDETKTKKKKLCVCLGKRGSFWKSSASKSLINATAWKMSLNGLNNSVILTFCVIYQQKTINLQFLIKQTD